MISFKYALKHCSLDIVQHLVELGAYRTTCHVMAAVNMKCVDVALYLIDSRIPVGQFDSKGQSLLHAVVSNINDGRELIESVLARLGDEEMNDM